MQLRVRSTAFRGTHPHDVAPARDGGVWYTAQHTGQLGWLDPKTGPVAVTARRGLGAARRHRRAGRRAVDHRRRPQRDRARRPATRKVRRFPLPASSATRTSTRPRSTAAASSGSPARAGSTAASTRRAARCGCSGPARRGPVRDHGDACGRGLLRVACRQLPRTDRRAERARRPCSTADRRPGARRHGPTRGPHLDQRVERRQGRMYDPRRSAGAVASARLESEDAPSTSTSATRSGSPTSARTRSCGSTRSRGVQESPASADAAVRQILGRQDEVWGAGSGTDKLVGCPRATRRAARRRPF